MTKVALISMWIALQYRRGSGMGLLWRIFRSQLFVRCADINIKYPTPKTTKPVDQRAR
jgi:hypothetical protein